MITEFIQKQLKSMLDTHSIVIWYDRDEAFRKIFDQIGEQECAKLQYEGSYFELKYRAEPYLGKAGTKLLIYIPKERQKKQNILLELEAIGGHWERSFAEVIRDVAGVEWNQEYEELLQKSQLSLGEWESILRSEGPVPNLEALAAIFGTQNLSDILLRFITDSSVVEEVKQKGCAAELIQAFQAEFGFPDEAEVELESIVKPLQQQILLSDYFVHRQGKDDFPYAHLIPQGDACEKLAAIAERWRDSYTLRTQYVSCANQIESEFQSLEASYGDINAAQDVETFASVDKYMFLQINELFADTSKLPDLLSLLALCTIRQEGFWALHDETIGSTWEAAKTGIQLLRSAQEIQTELQAASLTFQEQIERYANFETGWYRFDQSYRRWCEIRDSMDELPFENLESAVEKAYSNALYTMNWRLAETLQERKPLPVPQEWQNRYPIQVLSNDEGPTAFFFVDALRYELGVDLFSRCAEGFSQKIEFRLASLPSITEVGMPYLLPDISTLTLYPEKNSIYSTCGEASFKVQNDRRKYLVARYGDECVISDLSGIVGIQMKSLKRKVKGKHWIFVMSRDIDSLGEEMEEIAINRFSPFLNDLKKAASRLAKCGVRQIVFTSDHGFLYLQELSEDLKIQELPGKETILARRRLWAGKGATEGNYLRFSGEDLGLDCDFMFAFPKGIAAFKTQGGSTRYFHGGISFQELIVPVIVLQPKEALQRVPAKVLLQAPEVIHIPYFQVTLSLELTLFTDEKQVQRVRCYGESEGNQVTRMQQAGDETVAGEEIEISDKETTLLMQLDNMSIKSFRLHVENPLTGENLIEPREIRVESQYDDFF